MAITADYYVDAQNGDDGNAGTSTGAALATMAAAAAVVSAGDIVALNLGGASAEVISSTVTASTAGSVGNTIQWIGVNTSWDEDGTQYVIDGNSAVTTVIVSNGIYNTYRNITVKNATADGWTGGSYTTFVNCTSRDNTNRGWDMGASARICWYGCNAIDNGWDGFYRVYVGAIINCKAIGNGREGIVVSEAGFIQNCIVHANRGGIITVSSNGITVIKSCTIDGNSADGISDNNGSTAVYNISLWYNRITNNGAYGIEIGNASSTAFAFRNYFYNNTSGEVLATGEYIGEDDDVSMAGDGYTNRASDNFTLTESAEGRRISIGIGGDATNITYQTAGALIPTDTSGGGGGFIQAGSGRFGVREC